MLASLLPNKSCASYASAAAGFGAAAGTGDGGAAALVGATSSNRESSLASPNRLENDAFLFGTALLLDFAPDEGAPKREELSLSASSSPRPAAVPNRSPREFFVVAFCSIYIVQVEE